MGLWVTIVIWALFVAVTLWPPVRRGWAGFLVFLMTMTPNELPLVLLVVFGLAVGPAVLAPPIGETTDTIAVLAASLVAAGLVWVQVRARSTARVLDAALRDGLTPQGWDRPPTRPAVSVWWRGILLPFQRHGRAVRRIGGVAYGPLPAHRLDLYLPRNRAPSGPVLVHLHGGGFVQGRKSREGVTLLNQLAAREQTFKDLEDILARDLSTLPLLQGKQFAIAGAGVSGAADTLDASFKFRLGSLSK